MTKQADYTKEEWELLCTGPMLAGLGVSLLDPGFISTAKEVGAIVRATQEGKTTYSENELIQAVIAEMEHSGDELQPLPEGTTAEDVLAKLVKIDALLDQRAAAEGGLEGIGYRNFLLHIADQAANASGGFLGFGKKVSEEEATYLTKLKEILFREQKPAS